MSLPQSSPTRPVRRSPLRSVFECAVRLPMHGPMDDCWVGDPPTRPCPLDVIVIGGKLHHVRIWHRGLAIYEIGPEIPDGYTGHAPIKGRPRKSWRTNGPVRARARRPRERPDDALG